MGAITLGPLAGAYSLWECQLVAFSLLPAERRQLVARYHAHVQHASHQLTSIPADSPYFPQAMLPAAEAAIRSRDAGGVIPLEPVFRLLARVAENNPDDLNAQRWLAIVCLDLNLKEESLAALRAVGRLDAADGRAHRSLGLMLSSHAHVGPAMEAYREALGRNLEPHVRAEVIVELARLEVKHGLAARALETLARCPASFADDPDCLTLRAAALAQIGTEEGRREARTLLERVLQAQPRHAEALVTLAHLHLDEEQTSRAIALLERSLQAAPGDDDVHSRLALAYRQMGDGVKAEHHTRRADEVREGKKALVTLVQDARREIASADVRVRAAEICVQLQRWREARVWLRAALACNPTHAAARELLRRVESEQRAAR
jgi:tetratricopeptide (TPR) repeat protein